MKISHFGIKLSISILLLIILATNMVYWKSISTLSNHITSIIAVSGHQETGEVFHSAVHSMMMEAENATARYIELKQEAEDALRLLQDHVESLPAGESKETLILSTSTMKLKYENFKEYTDNYNQDDNQVDHIKRNISQELFDSIFSDYKTLSLHHTEQRKELLIKSQKIQYSIKYLQILLIAIATISGLLVILYLDRVTLKIFDVTENLALRDKLTGLYNRHAMDRIIKQFHPKSSSTPKSDYGIIMLDIDHFKSFNDTYGHSTGDKVLTEISKILLEAVRADDKVIRLGGEEFLIFLPRAKAEGTERVAKKIGLAIEETLLLSEDRKQPLQVTVSIGFATYPDDRETFQENLDTADRRLYIAKNNGRNMVVGPDKEHLIPKAQVS